MKRLFISVICAALALGAMASDVKIDKENCTITKDGKTYNLYGKVKIVDSFEDIKVKIVDCFEDADIKIVDCFEDSCGKVKLRARKGQSVKGSSISMVLNRWRNNHRITKINESTWRKTNC